MNEPQTWTAIGILGTALFAMLTLMSTLFLRLMQAEFRAVRSEIGSLRTEMTAEFRAVRTEMTAEFRAVRTEIGHLDRDVQGISKRVFGDDAA